MPSHEAEMGFPLHERQLRETRILRQVIDLEKRTRVDSRGKSNGHLSLYELKRPPETINTQEDLI